ncbi:MAG: hypothetical protein M3506_10660, partial [Chloroflexota bacterium]|nr:hypothetical protein [Chloroflexota bacterium]
MAFLLVSQLLLAFIDQLSLFFGGTGPLRLLVRMGTYGASLLLLLLIPGRGWRHPATKPAVVALWIVGISILHPTTNTLLAAMGQAALY